LILDTKQDKADLLVKWLLLLDHYSSRKTLIVGILYLSKYRKDKKVRAI